MKKISLFLLFNILVLRGVVSAGDLGREDYERAVMEVPAFGADANFEKDVHQAIIETETKKIEIPGHPHAFNPSIVRWKGRILMSFREIVGGCSDIFPCWAQSRIGLVWLDEEFNPASEVFTFDFEQSSHVQDPRLVTVGETLYIVYSDHLDDYYSWGSIRMLIARLEYDGRQFSMVDPEPWTSFYGQSDKRAEKNWVPFAYRDRLLMAYSISPHIIFEPLWGTEFCKLAAIAGTPLRWPWGEIRGGTPAIEIGNYYLSFFHSSVDAVSSHSGGAPALHYFMGAYLFSRRPPFYVTHISREPIIGKGFYSGENYEYYWKPVCVVFPCGILVDEEAIWVSYGRQDHECWVVKFDREALLQSLVPTGAGP